MKFDATLLVPLFNRPEVLKDILAWLDKQTYPHNKFEVILIDDSGPENYQRQKEVIDQTDTKFTVSYLTTNLPKEVNGVTIARNIGIRRASSPLIIFMDDDVIPHPHLIAEHIQSHKETERLILIGYKAEDKEILSQSLPIEVKTQRGLKELKKSGSGTLGAGNFSTCNASVKKRHLEKAGLFDESFAQPNEYGYEDREIGQRLLANNMLFRFTSRAVIYYIPKKQDELDQRKARAMQTKAHKRFKKIQSRFKRAQTLKRLFSVFSKRKD